MQLKEFANDKLLVLNTLYERQMPYKKGKYVSITQQELADLCHFSKAKSSGIVKWLIENGFVEKYQDNRSRYSVTEKGKNIIKIFKKEI